MTIAQPMRSPPSEAGSLPSPATTPDARTRINTSVAVYAATDRAGATVSAEEVFNVYYTSSGTRFEPDQATERRLLAIGTHAARIEIIGRTDGDKPNPADDEIALRRVIAARKFFLAHGADPTTIYLQYASATDYVGDNTTSFGRSQNRRVEIRIK